MKFEKRTREAMTETLKILDWECDCYEWDTKEYNKLQSIMTNIIDVLEDTDAVVETQYQPCPICGGEIEFKSDIPQHNGNDELLDTFQCKNCKTTFESDGLSDILYLYFKEC